VKHINDTTNDKQQKVTAFFPIRRSARKTKNIVNEEKQLALEKAITSQNEDGLKVRLLSPLCQLYTSICTSTIRFDNIFK